MIRQCIAFDSYKCAIKSNTGSTINFMHIQQEVVGPPAAFTVNDKLQFCPPKLMANVAVPAEVGVPDIA